MALSAPKNELDDSASDTAPSQSPPPSAMTSFAAPTQGNAAPSAPRVLSPAQLEIQATARQRTDALLRDLWKRKLPAVREQIRLLERVLHTIDNATLTAPLRQNAAMAAHKLAGSLGMFGYHDGTRIARDLESSLDSDQPLSRPIFAALLQQLTTSLGL